MIDPLILPKAERCASAFLPLQYDGNSFFFDGKREFLISGEIHFSRSTRDNWPKLLDQSRKAGINCIALYVFWGWHETEKDFYDFTGDRDLQHFLRLCAARGLYVLLRVGPYCCGEWSYGGFPFYLRDEPNIVLRTCSPPYLARVEKYFRRLFAEFLPHMTTRGGPVALVQIENEYANVAKRYGASGQRYIAWLTTLVRELGVDVPLIMCEAGTSELHDVISTVNGFAIAPERIIHQRLFQPNAPIFWTELWPGWYDCWGYQHHKRDPQNIAFSLLHFISKGGSAWNYYMWHGGTNFGRNAMYLQITKYDFDCPIDEYGSLNLKGAYLFDLHRVLKSVQEIILGGKRAETERGVQWSHEGQTLLLELEAIAGIARLKDGNGAILFDTVVNFLGRSAGFVSPTWESIERILHWESWHEPLPPWRPDKAIRTLAPVEQLALTKDQTDYCWYSTEIHIDESGEQMVVIDYAADILNIFLDGVIVARTQPPFLENRGTTVRNDAAVMSEINPEEIADSRYVQFFMFNIERGCHRLDILVASLGLIKGDWMISGSMELERKGIWGTVKLNDSVLDNWELRPFLIGEQLALHSSESTAIWQPLDALNACTWYRSSFSLPLDVLKGKCDFRLDAIGLGKGMLFVNGRGLGRHWLIEACGWGHGEAWQKNGTSGISLGPAGEPTQRYYHVPWAWLKENNRIVLFEEQEEHGPQSLQLEMRKSITP